MIAKSRIAAALVACVVATGAGVATGVQSVEASACKGSNSRKNIFADPHTGSEAWEVKIDSCKASKLVDAYGNAKDASGLAGLLGAK